MDRMQNHTPATFATSQIAGQKRQRNREPISCQPCRSRKVACDREEPCGSCVKQKTVDKCSYRKPDLPSPDSDAQRPPTTAPRSNARSGKDINVDSRLDRVERAVDNLVALVESGNYANASSTQSRPSVDTNPLSFSYQNYKFDDRPPSVENPYSQGSLSAKSSELVYFVGPGGWTTQRLDIKMLFDTTNQFARQWAAFADLGKLFVSSKHRTLLQLYLPLATPSLMENDLLSLLPDRTVCDILVRRFLLTFNVTHPIVDPILYQADVNRFWNDQASVSKPWLLCFLAIIALGYQLPVDNGYGEPIKDGQTLGKDLMNVISNVLLSSSDLGGRPTVSVLQTLLCVCLSHKLRIDWVDGNDTISGLLGLATRMSFTMGLHRDPHPAQGIRTDYVMSTEHALLRRKIFLTLNLMDIGHSVEAGMPYYLRTCDYDHINGPELDDMSSYEKRLATALPTWSNFLVSIVSSRSTPQTSSTAVALSNLASQHADNEPSIPNGQPQQYSSITRALQTATLRNLDLRLLLAFDSGTLFHDPNQTSSKTAASLLASAKAILAHQKRLYDLADQFEQPARTAWHHLFVSLFRCTYAYASSTILLILRRTIFDDPAQRAPLPPGETIDDLLSIVNRCLDFTTNNSLALSIELIKEAMAWSGYQRSVAERLSICAQRGWKTFNMASPEGKTVMRSMGEAMDEVLRKARAAIDTARRSDDPSPALVKRTESEIAADRNGEQTATTAFDPGLLEGEALDQWTKETDALLQDLDLQWPYPLPLGDGSDWIF